MPQVDLENLVSVCAGGCNDSKIACDTLSESSTDDVPTGNDVIPDVKATASVDPDLPPESFWLSKDAEYGWFNSNAFYERKESTKGNSHSTSFNPNTNPNSNSNSQLSSVNLKSKAAIIGLPKTQKTTYIDSKRRSCKPANIRLFPKRPELADKSTIPVAEPGSPKVSCMGRVRSKRGQRRSNSLKGKEDTVEKPISDGEKKKPGFYSKVMSIFRLSHKKPSRLGSRKVVEESEEDKAVVVERRRESLSSKVRETYVNVETPSLGGVKRFASGRRSGSWTTEDFDQAIAGSKDSDRRMDPASRS